MALTTRLAGCRQYVCTSFASSRQAGAIFQALPRLSTRTFASQKPAVAPVPEDEFEEDEFDTLAGLPSAAKRRVMALKDVQKKYDEVNREYLKELALLQSKYQTQFAPLFDERREVVSGAKAVGKYDIEDDNEPDKGIEEFWLSAFANHDKVGPYITDRDAEVLRYLSDVRAEVLTGEDRGFKLTFTFAENPFFTNKTLEKTYILEPEDDVVPKQFVGCTIDWKEGQDVTVEQVKKRVKSKGKGAKAAPAFTVETTPCDSFFNLFDPPQIPTDPAQLGDEQMDELQEELTVDFDVGFAIKDQIIPRAVEWFTGEIAPIPDEDDYYGEDEYEDGADFDDEPAPSARGGRR